MRLVIECYFDSPSFVPLNVGSNVDPATQEDYCWSNWSFFFCFLKPLKWYLLNRDISLYPMCKFIRQHINVYSWGGDVSLLCPKLSFDISRIPQNAPPSIRSKPISAKPSSCNIMVTSSNGNLFCATGPLWWESTGLIGEFCDIHLQEISYLVPKVLFCYEFENHIFEIRAPSTRDHRGLI